MTHMGAFSKCTTCGVDIEYMTDTMYFPDGVTVLAEIGFWQHVIPSDPETAAWIAQLQHDPEPMEEGELS